MATQKLYAGAKLRELRTKIGLTQKDFAARLGISLPYLNQMENNNRPVSTTVVLALASESIILQKETDILLGNRGLPIHDFWAWLARSG